MTRTRLKDRRESETSILWFNNCCFTVTIGYFPDGRPGDVFASGAKTGSDMAATIADACVALSLMMQSGMDIAKCAKSLGRAGDGKTPASILGALADHIAAVMQEVGATHG